MTVSSGIRWGWAIAGGLVLICMSIAAALLVSPPDFVAAYIHSRPVSCAAMEDTGIRHGHPEKLRASHRDGGLRQFSYDLGHHAPGLVAPTVAIRAFDGWLLGSDRGEFGGELVYRPDEGEDVLLAHVNVEDLYRLPQGFIATTGRGTMDSRNGFGAVTVVTRGQGGTVAVAENIDLPGAPTSSWLLESGDLLVNTLGESIIIEGDGLVRAVRCRTGSGVP